MAISRSVLPSIALCSLVACTSVPRIVNEYRIDVQQGNVLTQDMVSQLRPGLSREQVRFILGTPILMDMFHANRWDYFFWLKKGKTGDVEKRRFSVFFDADGKLVSVSGDVTAAQPDDSVVVSETRNREIDLGSLPDDGSVTVPAANEQGFFGKLLETVGF
ncbi:outer membrane protein assembly factor BamE [Accumulibacter sp.]|uniref:outer membrane protein assembly factor BamE n=1 Tax=Accumulibacter sp. TaxID=2053492 RepID=UPI0025FAC6C8|nr:outer membrane protein assembly factor BamE [Accumulibacter sp.]MCM8595597.1 outer membrane protein assembly factor BamE [Accumulibacter sp.]MCM8624845.1 outer membrane protein assembly factor BamE [Accumulibacter sp.]MDS4049745.1 outer membrane protein assembly factor BamE [Accumulibacter sp.]